jgi:hypothetical protein
MYESASQFGITSSLLPADKGGKSVDALRLDDSYAQLGIKNEEKNGTRNEDQR